MGFSISAAQATDTFRTHMTELGLVQKGMRHGGGSGLDGP